MTDNTEYNVVEQLAIALEKGFTDDALSKARKQAKDLVDALWSDIEYRLKDEMANHLAVHVQRMAHRAVEAMLGGDDDQMRRYLGCRDGMYNGRDLEASVIRGKLFEPEAIRLRRQIVDAHADLLKSERILDLESQVASLTELAANLEKRLHDCYERR